MSNRYQHTINSYIYDDKENPAFIHIDELFESTVISFLLVMFKWSKDFDNLDVYSECFRYTLFLMNEVCIFGNMQGQYANDVLLHLVTGDVQILQLAEDCYWTIVVFSLAHEVAHAYLADIGKSTATNKRNARLGGLFGGGAFLIAVMILNFGLLANLADVYNLEIPSLFVAASIHPVFGTIFSILLIGAIYTTAVPMLYTVCNRISSDSKSKAYRIAAIVTAIVSIFGGQLSFSTMIGIIYPISGYAGIVIFAGMIYTKYIKKKKYEDFDEDDVVGKRRA